MREDFLVETVWLEEHLHDPNLRLVDLRGYVKTRTEEDGTQVAEYTGAREEYEATHIPGAIYLDWTRDIVDLDDPVKAQVAKPEKLARILGEAGIGDEHLVVAYDAHAAMQFSTRLWWVFQYYGHQNVRVLNGGWKAWVREGRPVTTALPDYPRVTFTARVVPSLRATVDEVLGFLNKPGITLVDARDEGQYTGRIRRGKHGGHIPGALSLPREELIDPETGKFRSEAELRQVAEGRGLSPENRVVAYCNGGVAATSVLFALSMLGYPSLTNYDGSWNEWGERDDVPVETGVERTED